MKRLSPLDAGFLLAETREMPMHVGGLHLYRPPDGEADEHLRKLFADFREIKSFRPPFNQKLAHPLRYGGAPAWAEDHAFDLDYHVRHSALPKPGRYREMFALLSRLHGSLLDRSRPLWECHLIEGLESGQFAVYFKMHHALVDGMASMRLTQSMLSRDPDDRDTPHPWETSKTDSPVLDDPMALRNVVSATAQQLQGQLGALPGVTRALGRLARSLRQPRDQRASLPFEAPKTILNTRISGARRIVAQSYPLARIKEVAKALHATINDIVLAMSAGALRRYLQERDALPTKPLVAMTPVAIRAGASDDRSNAVTMILANLGTHVADPARRLEIIQASMADGKAILDGMSYHEAMLYMALSTGPMMAPNLLGSLVGLSAPGLNVVISNVPGPRQPLYWQGARLEGLYPMSIVTHGASVNITVTSYVDSLDFGITACRRTMPQVQRLIDYLEDALQELADTAGLPKRSKPRARKPAAKRKA